MTGYDRKSLRHGARSLRSLWLARDAQSRALLSSAGSLFGTTVLTAGFGAIYWVVAAHSFPASAVGVAATAISAMVLIGRIATIGLGTLLMGELAQHQGSERRLIFWAATISALVGGVLGAAFISAAGLIAPELRVLSEPTGIVLFAIGVASTSSGFVLDQALIGLLRSGLQLLRNTVASIAKVILLGALGWIGFGFLRLDAPTLFLTWVAGGVASMILILAVPPSSKRDEIRARPQLPPGLVGLAARHHLLNLAILAPGLLLPLLVTAVISAEAAGYFYIAYTIANLAWAVPAALSMALYASGARDLAALSARMRLAFLVCMVAGVVLNLIILIGAEPLLAVFGASYAERAATLLRLMTLGIFPVTIISLYVPIARLERRFIRGTLLMVASMLVSFSFVVVGARVGGLDGVGLGWLIGVSIGTLPLVPAVLRQGMARPAAPVGQAPPRAPA